MISITSNNDIEKSGTIIYRDENENKILEFDNKSNVLGSKFAVYDKDGDLLYFIDEDVTSDFNEIEIQKDNITLAKLKRLSNLLVRDIAIESADDEYEFLMMPGILLKNGEKAAIIKHADDGIKRFAGNERARKINDEIKDVLDKRRQEIKESISSRIDKSERIKEKREEIKERLESIPKPKDIIKIRQLNGEMSKLISVEELKKLYSSDIVIEIENDENFELLLSIIFAVQLLLKR